MEEIEFKISRGIGFHAERIANNFRKRKNKRKDKKKGKHRASSRTEMTLFTDAWNPLYWFMVV